MLQGAAARALLGVIALITVIALAIVPVVDARPKDKKNGGETTTEVTSDASGGTVDLLPVDGGQIFADFLAQVRGTGECLVSAEDSFRATEAALLARQSADEGREITFPSH